MEMDLPPPQTSGGMSLHDTLSRRRSVRNFRSGALTGQELSQLLWSGQGISAPESGKRTAPSAGATFPLELYVVTANGLHHYIPEGHQLATVTKGDLRQDLALAANEQDCVAQAAATFVLAAVAARTEAKYGERAKLYVKLDAGHAAQNLLLEAVALGLGGVPIGSFSEAAVSRVLGLPDDHEPLYLVAVGHV